MLRRFVAWAAKVSDEHLPPMIKGEITEKVRKKLENNIYWDGTLLNQMNNI